MSITLSQPTPAYQSSPSFCTGTKFAEVEQPLLSMLIQQNLQCTSPYLMVKATQHQIWSGMTRRQINRWRPSGA